MIQIHYSFDVVICFQVYEHVKSAKVLMKEIYRVLKPGGLVYFAAGNRFCLIEQHYNLPLLSAIPRPFSHIYLNLFRGKPYYYEKHFSYWGLKKLTTHFRRIDYTKAILNDPFKYKIDYMIPPNTVKHKIAKFISKTFYLVSSIIYLGAKKGLTHMNYPQVIR
jgi:SAM-dependent methyltransferase